MYTDYAFYAGTYGGGMPEGDFKKYEPRAEEYIRYFLFSKAGLMNQEPIPDLQKAVCAVSDVLGEYYSAKASRTAQGGSGAAVKSENNDGYSVSYAVEQADGETEENYLRKKAYDAAYLYLLPMGLLSRKVGCCCDHKRRCDCL